eukprot:jgi/Chlat1/2651/Chrsp178S02507
MKENGRERGSGSSSAAHAPGCCCEELQDQLTAHACRRLARGFVAKCKQRQQGDADNDGNDTAVTSGHASDGAGALPVWQPSCQHRRCDALRTWQWTTTWSGRSACVVYMQCCM